MKVHGTDLVFSGIKLADFSADIDGRLLEGPGGVQVVVFEGVKVEDAGNDLEYVLTEGFVEGEGFQAGQGIGRWDEILSSNRGAGVSGGGS